MSKNKVIIVIVCFILIIIFDNIKIKQYEKLVDSYKRTDDTFYMIKYYNENGIIADDGWYSIGSKESLRLDFIRPIVSLTIVRGIDKPKEVNYERFERKRW